MTLDLAVGFHSRDMCCAMLLFCLMGYWVVNPIMYHVHAGMYIGNPVVIAANNVTHDTVQ